MEPVPLPVAVRAALAVLLLAGFYLVAAAVLAVLAGLSFWFWAAAPGPVAEGASYLLAATAAGLLVPLWALLRARPDPPLAGVPVTEAQAPGLWAQVRELAAAVGTRPPDEIRLVFLANALVWEQTGRTGLRSGRRLLYLGVPLLPALTVGQLRAVLAHELGHYSQHHMRLGAVTYRGGQAIIHTIHGVGPRSLPGLVLTGYAVLYFLVSMAVLRRRELAADRAAVRLAGRAATRDALRELPRLAADWDSFLVGYAWWSRSRGYSPAELLDWFGWLRTHRPDQLARVRRPFPAGSPWDSHPSTDARLAQLARGPDPPVPPDPRPARSLLAEPDLLASTLATAEFHTYVERSAQREAERDAERLFTATAQVQRSRRCWLGCTLDLLAAGRAGDLDRALRLPDTAASDEPGGLADLVYAAAAADLVTAGGGRWRHLPGEPLAVRSAAGEPILLRAATAAACRDPAAVAELRALLRAGGVWEHSLTGREAAGWPASRAGGPRPLPGAAGG